MRYTRFEDLPVWNTAIELAVQVYTLTERLQFRRRRSLRDQIERAAVSVSKQYRRRFRARHEQRIVVIPIHRTWLRGRGAFDAVLTGATSGVSRSARRD